MKHQIQIPKIRTYNRDKRKPIEKLYKSFFNLNEKFWTMDIICNQKIIIRNKQINFPILGFKTKKQGKSLWLLAGIHGEEPAGSNAISENIIFLNKLAKKIPIVLIPLCNPGGYFRNWRYLDLKKASKKKKAKSIGDSEYLLIDLKNPNKPRTEKPSSDESLALTSYVIKISKTHQPLLELDFHEDDSRGKLYIYSQGKLGAEDPVAKEIVSILKNSGFKFYEEGDTRFNQPIINGIVSNIKDNSIDELICSKEIIVNNKKVKGPSAKSVVVIETTVPNILLKKRINAHSKILKQSERFFKTADKIWK